MEQVPQKRKQGFACMTLEQRKAIASKGGKAAKNRHRFTKEEAAIHGSKGGKQAHALGKAHRFTSETGQAAGRLNKGRKNNGRQATAG